jgi:hypothetical protein
MIDFIIQTLCTVFLFTGLWATGNYKLRGPLLCFVAESLTTVVGITHHVWSIILIGAILFVVQLRNFIKWKHEGKPW